MFSSVEVADQPRTRHRIAQLLVVQAEMEATALVSRPFHFTLVFERGAQPVSRRSGTPLNSMDGFALCD